MLVRLELILSWVHFDYVFLKKSAKTPHRGMHWWMEPQISRVFD
jgi:hypothetical protein